jgi:hypothetical protein
MNTKLNPVLHLWVSLAPIARSTGGDCGGLCHPMGNSFPGTCTKMLGLRLECDWSLSIDWNYDAMYMIHYDTICIIYTIYIYTIIYTFIFLPMVSSKTCDTNLFQQLHTAWILNASRHLLNSQTAKNASGQQTNCIIAMFSCLRGSHCILPLHDFAWILKLPQGTHGIFGFWMPQGTHGILKLRAFCASGQPLNCKMAWHAACFLNRASKFQCCARFLTALFWRPWNFQLASEHL